MLVLPERGHVPHPGTHGQGTRARPHTPASSAQKRSPPTPLPWPPLAPATTGGCTGAGTNRAPRPAQTCSRTWRGGGHQVAWWGHWGSAAASSSGRRAWSAAWTTWRMCNGSAHAHSKQPAPSPHEQDVVGGAAPAPVAEVAGEPKQVSRGPYCTVCLKCWRERALTTQAMGLPACLGGLVGGAQHCSWCGSHVLAMLHGARARAAAHLVVRMATPVVGGHSLQGVG